MRKIVLNKVSEPKATWGGPWTEKKLQAFEEYVLAYLKIMHKNPYWKTIYFDGFAGCGERNIEKNAPNLFDLDLDSGDANVYRGAAERLIKLQKPDIFDWYYFIDKDATSIKKLESKLKSIQESKNKNIIYRANDCNEELVKLSGALKKRKYAALIFLDPFGMQINWESIAQLAGSRSDLWILLPTGMIINRLLDKNGELKNIKKLISFFGINEESIRKKFYKTIEYKDLFGKDVKDMDKIIDPINKIAELYIENLKQIWKYVSHPLRLNNKKGVALFHFILASNSQAAQKIANHIIRNV
ncbi:MAG: three-Cys-motif partner protein TcmP [Calditrichaceae bacterium]|nr:three-Cys-motif partner protein TcmP [Calditrichaceae bacterium]MBN2707634.1 three-Cys-motif partner protein TcmP [Calditrichaceae bacterium]RQV93196.1 MAG: three-Cys-motif partner protein TcmP [Calditrichota bacterium]